MDLYLVNPLDDPAFGGQSVAYTGTAGSTTGWPAGPQGVIVWSDQACYVIVGVGVTATSAACAIPANIPIPFAVPLESSGAPFRVSAIQISTGGTVYAKPINKA